MRQLIDEYGVPHFIKSDIEGADRFCVLGLDASKRPHYLSYEVGEDFGELLRHCREIGYSKFKIINQVSFRELANQGNFRDRLILGVTRRLGYADFKTRKTWRPVLHIGSQRRTRSMAQRRSLAIGR